MVAEPVTLETTACVTYSGLPSTAGIVFCQLFVSRVGAVMAPDVKLYVPVPVVGPLVAEFTHVGADALRL